MVIDGNRTKRCSPAAVGAALLCAAVAATAAACGGAGGEVEADSHAPGDQVSEDIEAARSVSTSHVVEAPAETVWALLQWDNAELFLDAGFFSAVSYERAPAARNLPGSTRTLHLHDGPPVRETMDAVDDAAMTVRYSLDEPESYSVERYEGRYSVEALDGGRSRVTIAARYVPGELRPEEFEAMWKANQALIFAYLDRRLGGAD